MRGETWEECEKRVSEQSQRGKAFIVIGALDFDDVESVHFEHVFERTERENSDMTDRHRAVFESSEESRTDKFRFC